MNLLVESDKPFARQTESNQGQPQSQDLGEVSRTLSITPREIKREIHDRNARGLRRVVLKGIKTEELEELLRTSTEQRMKNPVLFIDLNEKDEFLSMRFVDLSQEK